LRTISKEMAVCFLPKMRSKNEPVPA